MQLGFVSAIFGDLSLEAVLAFAGAEGYECVEVMCWPVGRAGSPVRRRVSHRRRRIHAGEGDDVRALCEQARRRRFRRSATIRIRWPPTPRRPKRAQEHLKKVIDAAPLLGLTNVNSFVGAHTKLPLDENLKRFAEVWPDLIRYAEGPRHEDRHRKLPDAVSEHLAVRHESGPDAGDLAADVRDHSVAELRLELRPVAPGDAADRSDRADPRIRPADFPRPRQGHADRPRTGCRTIGSLELPMERSTAKMPGLGDVDWGRWIGALADVDYNGAVCVEVEDEAFTETLEGRKRSLRISRNVLQPIVIIKLRRFAWPGSANGSKRCRRRACSDAARVSLEARLSTVAYWLPLASRQIDDDIEKVHQLRVSTRRAIAALRLYRDWLPGGWLPLALEAAQKDATCGWGGRDLDVLAEWIREELDGPVPARLLAVVADERAAAQPAIMAIADKCEAENRFRRQMYGLLAAVRPRGKRQKKQDVSFHNWAETQLAQAAEGFFAALPNQISDLSALHEFRIQRQTAAVHARALGVGVRSGVEGRSLSGGGGAAGATGPDQRLRGRRRAAATLAAQDRLRRRSRSRSTG